MLMAPRRTLSFLSFKMTALPAGFLLQPHVLYHHGAVHGFEHIVYGKRGGGGGGEGFHLDAGLSGGDGLGTDTRAAIVIQHQQWL